MVEKLTSSRLSASLCAHCKTQGFLGGSSDKESACQCIFFSLSSILPLRSTPSSQALYFLAAKIPYINDWSSLEGFFFFLSSWVHAEFLQSCWTLGNAMDYSPVGCPVFGILQARILEWIVLPSYRGSSWPWDQTHISLSLLCLLHW